MLDMTFVFYHAVPSLPRMGFTSPSHCVQHVLLIQRFEQLGDCTNRQMTPDTARCWLMQPIPTPMPIPTPTQMSPPTTIPTPILIPTHDQNQYQYILSVLTKGQTTPMHMPSQDAQEKLLHNISKTNNYLRLGRLFHQCCLRCCGAKLRFLMCVRCWVLQVPQWILRELVHKKNK